MTLYSPPKAEEKIRLRTEMVLHFSNGLTRAQAAKRLGITERQLEWHLEEMKTDNKAKNTTHLVAMALRNKVIV